MNFVNENNQVVAEDFAKGFINHCGISLRAKAVTKFALHHAEGRFHVRPLVVMGQKVVPAIHEVVEHFSPCFDFAASFFAPVAGAAVRLERFLGGKNIAPFIGLELRRKLAEPVIFQSPPAVSGGMGWLKVYGFDVTLLIDICKAIIAAEADGKLNANQKGLAKQAHIILNASAKAGIKGLVYALAGYDATREEVIAAFRFYVREEARDYEKEFPNQLYEEWYRLYELPKPERNKPWKFMHLTLDHVYRPLAKSNGQILELTQQQRQSANARWKKLHQFLSDIGVKALRTHLGQLLGIARISRTSREYEGFFQQLFGDQRPLFPQN